MNKLQEAIARLAARDNLDEQNKRLLQMLREKDEELGCDISDEEAEEAVDEAIRVLLQEEQKKFQIREEELEDDREDAGDNHREDDLEDDLEEDPEDDLEADPDANREEAGDDDREEDVDDDWEEELEDDINIVHSVFRDMDLHYRDYVHQKGVHAFVLKARNNGRLLEMKVYLENSPKVCRIDAIFPFLAEEDFIFPLCEKLMQENYPRRFGALQYDAKDRELSYRYSFPITHGLHRDDFRAVFMAVVASADASYNTVKQYAVGRFHKAERDSITCRAQKLIIELSR